MPQDNNDWSRASNLSRGRIIDVQGRVRDQEPLPAPMPRPNEPPPSMPQPYPYPDNGQPTDHYEPRPDDGMPWPPTTVSLAEGARVDNIAGRPIHEFSGIQPGGNGQIDPPGPDGLSWYSMRGLHGAFLRALRSASEPYSLSRHIHLIDSSVQAAAFQLLPPKERVFRVAHQFQQKEVPDPKKTGPVYPQGAEAWKEWKKSRLKRLEKNAESFQGDGGQIWRKAPPKPIELAGTEPCEEIEHVSIYDANKPEDQTGESEQETDFKKAAENFKTAGGKPAKAVPVKSVSDLVEQLRKLVTVGKDAKCKCIKSISIHAHGVRDANGKPLGGFRLGRDEVGGQGNDNTEQEARNSAEHFGLLIAGALCSGATINLMVCWAAARNFHKYLGRVTNARVRASQGAVNVLYDKDLKDPESKPIKWETPEGIDVYDPPKGFPTDKNRGDFSDDEGSEEGWGEITEEKKVGEHKPQPPKFPKWREGTTLWD